MGMFNPENNAFRPVGTSQDVAFNATAANSTALSSTARGVRLAATAACRINFIGTAIATSQLLLPNFPEYFYCSPGAVISVIQESAAGKLNITELES